MIRLSQSQLNDIQSHGKEAYPEECCGAMLGEVEGENQKLVQKILRIENNWTNGKDESRHRRFAVTAEDYQNLEKKAKELQLTLLGFYHTHPDHPAKPSQTDLSYAWPFFSYIILAVEKSQPKAVFSYELNLEKKEFRSEEMQIL